MRIEIQRKVALALGALVVFGLAVGCTTRFGSSGNEGDGGADAGETTCGNGILEAGEVCDGTDLGGQTCGSAVGHPDGELRCTQECRLDISDCSTCGDGEVEGSETCDDGAVEAGDGCDGECRTEPGWVCLGEPSECEQTCGNGTLDPGETCDDGNITPEDGCSPSCVVGEGWECYGVPSVCTPVCGDGLVVGTEECDDDNGADGDGCSSVCEVEHGWSCEGEPSVCITLCGDGVVSTGEACDDGNSQGGDGCSAQCEVEPGWICEGEPSGCSGLCGDGVRVAGEECDDGNDINGDGCSSLCEVDDYTACSGAMDYQTDTTSYVNCLFYSNDADVGNGGGLHAEDGANTTVANSIFWGNNAYEIDEQMASVTVVRCLIQGGYSGGTGVIDDDPLFLDPATGDFHLTAGSPCIDAGQGDLAPELDKDENPRVDDPSVANTGQGDPDYADIGPFEYQP